VLIWQALGPRPEGANMPDEYFQWLQIEPPPEQGEYMLGWQKYLRQTMKDSDRIRHEATSSDTLSWPTRPWTAKEKPVLAAWLKRNENPLGVAIEATRRKEYFNPLVPRRTEEWSPGLMDALLSSVQRCRELGSALACRAMLRLAEGNAQEAWQDLLACHRLSRLVARGGFMIELLVGIAIEIGASPADVAFLAEAKLGSKQILACWGDLRRLSPIPPVADKVDLAERFVVLETMMLTARQGTAFLNALANSDKTAPTRNGSTSRLFTHNINWDPGLRNANRWYDRCAAALRIPDRMEREREVNAITQDVRNLKQEAYSVGGFLRSQMGAKRRGEAIGNVIITLQVPLFTKIQGAADRHEQNERNLSIAFALAAYQRDKGRYPDKLDELAPTYLKTIPNDLFSKKPLIYRPQGNGYLLYSVGLNGIDDDGRGHNDEPRGDDLSIRVPVPDPPRPRQQPGPK
jgi:hypothetical protein